MKPIPIHYGKTRGTCVKKRHFPWLGELTVWLSIPMRISARMNLPFPQKL